MKKYGLIGYPLGHSFSKEFFNEKFRREGRYDYSYENFPVEDIEDIHRLIENNPELEGFNVTIPYKEAIIPYLDQLDDLSYRVQAVNTVKIIRESGNYQLHGYNTDVIGFRDSLKPLLHNVVRSAIVLGSGGASKAVRFALRQLHIDSFIVSRKRNKENRIIGYEDLDESVISENLLIINTTPLGTFPEVQKYPDIPYSLISENHILYDLVYNPPETLFLKKGKEQGAAIKNGLEMLERQALAAWDIWNDNSAGFSLGQNY